MARMESVYPKFLRRILLKRFVWFLFLSKIRISILFGIDPLMGISRLSQPLGLGSNNQEVKRQNLLKKLWNLMILPKVKIFVWLFIHEKLQTRVRLSKFVQR